MPYLFGKSSYSGTTTDSEMELWVETFPGINIFCYLSLEMRIEFFK